MMQHLERAAKRLSFRTRARRKKRLKPDQSWVCGQKRAWLGDTAVIAANIVVRHRAQCVAAFLKQWLLHHSEPSDY